MATARQKARLPGLTVKKITVFTNFRQDADRTLRFAATYAAPEEQGKLNPLRAA